MYFFKTAIFLLFSLSLIGCGGKKGITKTSLILGGAIDVVAGQNGGTMVYGRQISGGSETFAIKLPFAGDLELTNGTWNFAAVSWDGVGGLTATNDILEGTVRCAVSNVDLIGGEQSVSMSLSSAGCFNQFFGDSFSKETSGEPKKFLPVTCAFTDKYDSSRVDESSCTNSVATSYIVELPQKLPSGTFAPGLQSRCITENNPADRYLYASSSLIRIPMFLPFRSDEPLIRVTMFEGGACTGDFQTTNIRHPLAGLADRPVELETDDGTYPNENVFLIHNPPCNGTAGNQATPFNSEGDIVLCNATQFASEISTTPGANYVMGADIDLGLLSTLTGAIVNTTFTGTFDGRNHTLYGAVFSGSLPAMTGIFQTINGTVENLKISNTSFTNTTDIATTGVLAGQLSASAMIDNIRFENITVVLNGTGSGDKFGVLAGMYTPAGASRVERIRTKNISINSQGYSSVGGLIGYTYTADARVRDVIMENTSIQFDNAGPGKIGGVIGNMQNNSTLMDVNVKNIQIGTSGTASGGGSVVSIGGLVGSLDNGSMVKAARVSGAIYTASSNVGGAVGYSDPEVVTPAAASTTISDVASTVSPVNGASYVGGVLGKSNGGGNGVIIDLIRYLGTSTSVATINALDIAGGLVGGAGGTSAPHSLGKSYSKYVAINTSASNAIAGGLVATGSKLTANEVFAEEVTISTVADGTNKVGGLFGEFSEDIVLSDGYFYGSILGATAGRSLMIYSVGASSFINYTYGIAKTGTADNALIVSGPVTSAATYSNVTGADTTVSTINDIIANSTLSGDGYLATIWNNTSSSGDKTLKFLAPLELFANSATGSRDDPYLISSTLAWNTIGDNPSLMNKTFKLAATLDFNTLTFIPVGSATNPFSGTLIGAGNVIKNIVSTCTGTAGGIISHMSNTVSMRSMGIVGPLVLENLDFRCFNQNVGALVGTLLTDTAAVNDGGRRLEIENIVVTNSHLEVVVSSTSGAVGGLIGSIDFNNVNSRISNITVQNSDIIGNSNGEHVGGVIGKFVSTGPGPTSSARVEAIKSLGNSIYAYDSIIGTGGVFGYYQASSGNVETRKIIANNTVSGISSVGGVIGDLANGRLSEAVAKGSVAGGADIGGVVGSSSAAGNVINGSYSEASVTASVNGGVFAGSDLGSIQNSWAAGSITGGGTLSYAVPQASIGGTGLAYVGPSDEAITGGYYITAAQFKIDQTFFNTHFVSVDPFIFTPGDYPRPYFEIFPEFFVD